MTWLKFLKIFWNFWAIYSNAWYKLKMNPHLRFVATGSTAETSKGTTGRAVSQVSFGVEFFSPRSKLETS